MSILPESRRQEVHDKNGLLHFRKAQVSDLSGDVKMQFDNRIRIDYTDHGRLETFGASGNGLFDALQRGLRERQKGIIDVY